MPDDPSADALNAADARRWLDLARRGAFADAWAVSDRIRSRTRVFGDAGTPRHRQLLWNGMPVEARHVLVHCYHGLGDTIQFARYLPALRARAASVTVWAQPKLLSLLRTIDADIRWEPLSDGAPPLAAEVDVEIMELPQVFRTTVETIPGTVPYLRAPAPRLAPASRMRVGLAWRAGDWDGERSVPFGALAPLIADSRIDWYNLQHPWHRGEAHPRLRPLASASILSTASAMRALDLVVTVDSMPAHLAGALGVRTWTLLRQPADWRWLEGRTDSPWYPSMRLFRQRRDGDWRTPLAQVRQALDVELTRP